MKLLNNAAHLKSIVDVFSKINVIVFDDKGSQYSTVDRPQTNLI